MGSNLPLDQPLSEVVSSRVCGTRVRASTGAPQREGQERGHPGALGARATAAERRALEGSARARGVSLGVAQRLSASEWRRRGPRGALLEVWVLLRLGLGLGWSSDRRIGRDEVPHVSTPGTPQKHKNMCAECVAGGPNKCPKNTGHG